MRILVLLAVAASAGCGLGDCDVDATGSTLAGDGATDCGVVAGNADATAAVQCALDAQAANHAFRLHLARRGIDSQVADVFVRTADGRSLKLFFDSLGSSSGAGETARIWRTACERFDRADASAAGPDGADLACASPQPEIAECR